jgi:hypothetical protein
MSVERDDFLRPEEAPDASSKLFREYAAEFVELARNATSADQRFLYLKAANIWQELGKGFDQRSGEGSPQQLRIAAMSCCARNATAKTQS